MRIQAFLHRLNKDRTGATAIEYGLIATLIAVALVASFIQLGNTSSGVWNNVSTKVKAASPSS